MPCQLHPVDLRRRRRQAPRCSCSPCARRGCGPEDGRRGLPHDAAGTLSIEWASLASVSSSQLLQVELASGLRHLGQAFEGAAPGRIRIAASGKGDGHDFAIADVVRMDPMDELEDSNRFDVTGGNKPFLRNRRFWQTFLGFEGNDELGLDLRTTMGGAYGSFIVQDARQGWSVFVGLAVTEEHFATQEQQESSEGVLGTAYSFFRFHDPEANIDAGLTVLPSLTESGRVRSEAKVRSRYEIVSDLFFEISLYGSYDTDPDEQADTKSDYGVTTSLGYSF